MLFQRRTSLAVKLTTLIAASAGIIFILMILFNYSFLKASYLDQARETAKLVTESKAQKVGLILARAEAAAATTAAKERIESELKIARSIQMNFLPKKFPPLPAGEFVEIAAILEPALEVGGGLYDYFLVNDRHLFFMIGDVADKGVPAALFMAVTKTLLKGLTEAGLEPSEILAKVNRELASENDALMFVTAFCGILDLETGELAYSNAGHNPPLLLRPGQEPQWLALPEGFVLGVSEKTTYHTKRRRLQPHDLVIAYTDAVVEAMDVHRGMYANDRLIKTVLGAREYAAEGLVRAVMASVTRFSQGASQADDITILALRFKGYKGQQKTS